MAIPSRWSRLSVYMVRETWGTWYSWILLWCVRFNPVKLFICPGERSLFYYCRFWRVKWLEKRPGGTRKVPYVERTGRYQTFLPDPKQLRPDPGHVNPPPRILGGSGCGEGGGRAKKGRKKREEKGERGKKGGKRRKERREKQYHFGVHVESY